MPRAIWTGSISFGLVNVPVKLYTAVRSADVSFVQLHGKDGGRIRYKKFCEVENVEVPSSEIVKAHEFSPGQYVVVEPEELEAADPEATHTIDIEDFVDLSQIDPLYYDHPYYLGPFNDAAERPYSLLVKAMEESHKVAVARVVLRTKAYLAALRPVNGVLVMSTMNWAEEVLPQSEVAPTRQIEVRPKELEMAQQLIESLSTDFDPTRYKNEYRDRLTELLRRKAEGQEIVTAPAAPEAETKVVDLMAALEESLSAARQARQQQKETRRTGGGTRGRGGRRKSG